MIIRIIFCTVFTLFTFTGCGLIYKQNIQQGNSIEQDDLDELYEGMSKRQVLFVLGTPSIKDPFHQDRWDYVQTFSRRGSDMVQRTVTLRFEDDLLTQIIGGDKPFGGDNDATSKNSASAGIASFVKKPGQASQSNQPSQSSDPNEAAVESAAEEVLAPEPAPDYSDERTQEDLDYQEQMDVLDQTPGDEIPGPDIDG